MHDTATCPICAPIVNTDAYRRGTERAASAGAVLVIETNPARRLLEETRR